MRRSTFGVAGGVLLLLVAACGGKREDPILRLSADEALQLGKELLAAEKYYKAQRHLEHAFEVEPNSRSGREALLLAADALYLKGGLDNYIKCEAKYRDFLNRFPTSDRADYAQFQVGNCLSARIEKPDRDQQVTKQSLDSYQELLRLYPTSPYVEKAEEKIVEVTDRLAMHELVVARFYDRYGRRGGCMASIGRLEHIDEEFPRFSLLDEALFRLWLGYEKCNRSEEAVGARQKLVERFPASPYVARLDEEAAEIAKERRKRGAPTPVPAPAATGDAAAEGETAEEDADGGAEGAADGEGSRR